jgi:hypothetical protein
MRFWKYAVVGTSILVGKINEGRYEVKSRSSLGIGQALRSIDDETLSIAYRAALKAADDDTNFVIEDDELMTLTDELSEGKIPPMPEAQSGKTSI